MLKINLLPPSEKKELLWRDFERLIIFLASGFLFLLVIFSFILASMFFSLSILLKAQHNLAEIRKDDPQIKDLLKIEKDISWANQRIEQVYTKQKDLILWTPILEELSKITPKGIYLTNLAYHSTSQQVILTGWANTRENLLLFQKKLEASPYYSNVKAPLSNLIKQKDIDFSFTLPF